MSQHISSTITTTTRHQSLRNAAKVISLSMNFRIRLLAMVVLLALGIGVLSSSRTVFAAGECQQVKGNESVVNNGNGTTSGAITQGGRLNGTTQGVFTSAFTPTPAPNTFSFTDDLTLTTNKGVLQTHNVTLFDAASGVFTAIARIDPNTSTGDFAGATGVLYINGKTVDGGATFGGEITGQICFAN
jgi:hypothetical protein